VLDQNGSGGLLGFEVSGIGGGDLRQPKAGMRLNQIRRFNLHGKDAWPRLRL
jgi:hypothetical protein